MMKDGNETSIRVKEREDETVAERRADIPKTERLDDGYRKNEIQSRMERLRQLTDEKNGDDKMRIAETDLQEVYKNACTGKESVEIIRGFSANKGFKNVLIRQYKEYSALAKETEIYANRLGYDLQKTSALAKAMMYITTAMNTLKDKSDSKLSEIMIQGIDMGIIAMTKIINRNSDENKSCSLAESMLALLQKNLEEMKLFL